MNTWEWLLTIIGEVKTFMIPYINNIIDEFPEEITSTVATLAGDFLFQTQEQTNNNTGLPGSK